MHLEFLEGQRPSEIDRRTFLRFPSFQEVQIEKHWTFPSIWSFQLGTVFHDIERSCCKGSYKLRLVELKGDV